MDKEKIDRKKYAKWLSDLDTLKSHFSAFARDKDGFLIYDTPRNAEKYMRVNYENSCKFVDMENEKIREEKKKEESEKEDLYTIRRECLKFEYDKEGRIKKVKVLIPKVVDFLLNKYNFKTIYKSKSEEIFVYQDGIYTKNGREIIETQTEEILDEYCSNHYVREILQKVKRSITISDEKFNEIDDDLICLDNGIYNLKTNELIDYDPKHYFKSKFKIKYDPNATCPKIHKFLKDVLYHENIDTIQEWFGFCLYRKYFMKKAIILFGDTDTGKTAFLNLLMNFIGKKNTAGISLQRISVGDKFALASLRNKYINIFDDLSSKDLIAGGFKIATGGGYITAEHKFGDPFQFINFAKHIFATNKIPSIKEIDVDDKAYYDRWIPIPFDNQIEKDKQDKFLIEKLTTNEELSGLLNYAIEGLRRLLKNKKFSFNKTPEEIKQIMEKHGDPLSSFCKDILVKKEGNKISKSIMYEIYSWYVNDKKLARLSIEQLGRRLEKYVPYILAKRDAKERFWENVSINTHMNSDTLDTLNNILRVKESEYKQLYKNLKKVSKESPDKEIVHDEIDFEKSGVLN